MHRGCTGGVADDVDYLGLRVAATGQLDSWGTVAHGIPLSFSY